MIYGNQSTITSLAGLLICINKGILYHEILTMFGTPLFLLHPARFHSISVTISTLPLEHDSFHTFVRSAPQ